MYPSHDNATKYHVIAVAVPLGCGTDLCSMEKLFVVLVASSVFGASILSAPLDGDCVRAFKRESGPSLRDGACFELLADVVVARNARMRACETIRRDGLCALLQNASLCEKLSGGGGVTSDAVVAEFLMECPASCLRGRFRLCPEDEPASAVSASRKPHYVTLQNPAPGIALAEPFIPELTLAPRTPTSSSPPPTALTTNASTSTTSISERNQGRNNEQMLIGVGVGIGGFIVIAGAGLVVMLRWRRRVAMSTRSKELDDPTGMVELPEDPVAVVGTLRPRHGDHKSNASITRVHIVSIGVHSAGHHPITDDDVYSEQVCPQPFVVPGWTMDSLQQQLLAGKFTTPEVLRESLQSAGMKLKGSGSSGEGTPNCNVYAARYRGEAVDLKMLSNKHSQENKLQFLQEAFIHAQFFHPNVVQLVGMVTVDDPLMMVMECMENGTLQQYIQKHNGSRVPIRLHPAFPPGTSSLFAMAHDIASGMTYLEAKNFVHGALTSSSIFVSVSGACKISNFGASLKHYMRKEKDAPFRLIHLPVRWSAPEVLENSHFSIASDVWSYGIVLYELWTLGAKPYEYLSNIKVSEQVRSGYRLPCPSNCPAHVHETMLDCWNSNPTDRPSFRHILSNLPAIAEMC
ncbi:uncharacterized protein [Oscarella lobularis]|uniref:uncharacterized protein isoform X2 n=1 Tax=Oscarella lobularis TaxID=121494 RepID=UPI00331389A9